MGKISPSALVGKNWKEITLVFLEFRGLIGGAPGSPEEQFDRISKRLRDSATKLGGEFLEVLGTEVVMAFGALHHTKRALSVVVDLQTYLNQKKSLYFSGALEVGEVVFSKRGESPVAILGPLLKRVRAFGEDLPPNSIVVSPRVKELVGHQFSFTPFERSLQGFLLQGFHSETSQIGDGGSLSHQKIREEILDSLGEFLGGRRKIFALQGEPGLGKSHLLKEIHRILTLSHLCSFRIKGSSCPGSYGILREIFRKILFSVSDSLPGNLKSLCPKMNSFQVGQVLSFLREGTSPPILELSQVMSSFAQNHRMALLLDDFDHSSREEQQALQQILQSEAFPLLLVFTLRPESPLALEGMALLKLLPLEDEEMVRLLQTKILERGLPTQFLRTLVKVSQGNPAFGLALLEEGKINAPSLPPLSNRAREILVHRIETLGREERWIVKVASAVGEKMPLPLLARVLEVEKEWLVDGPLRVLQERGIFCLKREKIYFSTAYLHRVTEDSLLDGQKRDLHRKIGEILERDTFDTGPLFQIEHLLKGGLRKRALDLALSEADRFGKQAESYEGLWLLEQVERLLEPLKKGERKKIEERRGELMEL